jgi:hypothetical protein
MKKLISILFYALVIWITITVTGLAMMPKRYLLPSSLQIVDDSRKVMLSQVGTKEATGRNDGVQIEKYLGSVKIYVPAPYCAAFVYFCFAEVACDITQIPIPRTAVANNIYNYARKKGVLANYAPAIDDLITWKYSNSWSGHIERIYEIHKAGWVLTVGANTSNGKTGSQREGNGVFIRRRNIYHPVGRMFVRGLVGWKYE